MSSNERLTPSPSSEESGPEPLALRRRIADLENEVTTLRQALALRRSNAEATYRVIFDSVSDSTLILDHETGAVVDANSAATTDWGYSRDELLGNPPPMLSEGPDGKPVTTAATWQRAMAGEPQRFEWLCRHGNGGSRHAEIEIKRVRLAGRDRVLAVIRDIGRKERERWQAALIEAQATALAELSTPLIPISERILVMPLIGTIDERRARQVMETLLEGVARSRADVAIVDITGVPAVDSQVADGLLRTARAVKLLGAQFVLTGIRPEIAQVLVALGACLDDIATHGTLEAGIAAALPG